MDYNALKHSLPPGGKSAFRACIVRPLKMLALEALFVSGRNGGP